MNRGQVETSLQHSGKPIKVKLQLDLAVGSRIGPGKIRLLELIGNEGSLARAARTMGLSYRRAWLFVQQVNAAFAEPAITTPAHRHGGSAARLTPFGQELIRRYRDLEAVTTAGGGEALDWFLRHQQQAAAGTDDPRPKRPTSSTAPET